MVFKQYKWGKRSFPVAAQVAAEEIERLREQNGGSVSAPDILASAAPESSPLHPCFQWDDQMAAHQYRLTQARDILRHVVVIVHDEDKQETSEVRAFVAYEPEEGPGENYREKYTHVKTAMETPAIREQLVERAWDELISWRNRYEKLQAFAKVFAAIDAVRRDAVA